MVKYKCAYCRILYSSIEIANMHLCAYMPEDDKSDYITPVEILPDPNTRVFNPNHVDRKEDEIPSIT